ncbi:MAG: hypothetical protein AB1489_04665 [Acidobacteriota bacterium]
MRRIVLFLLVITLLTLTATAQVERDRLQTNPIEPEGFLGLRLGHSVQYAEELLGDADIVRQGSLEWHFRTADYDPYEALTALADRGKINGFIAHIRANRLQFSDLSLRPEQNRLGTFHASRDYETSEYKVKVLVIGDDGTYVRRIMMSSKHK